MLIFHQTSNLPKSQCTPEWMKKRAKRKKRGKKEGEIFLRKYPWAINYDGVHDEMLSVFILYRVIKPALN